MRDYAFSGYDLQGYLAHHGFYRGKIDGIEGTRTKEATSSYLTQHAMTDPSVVVRIGTQNPIYVSYERRRLAVAQHLWNSLGFYDGYVDGLYGPATSYASEQWQNWLRTARADGSWLNDIASSVAVENTSASLWPTYDRLEQFYGAPGTNHVTLELPYPLRLAWDTKTEVSRTTVNRMCASAFTKVLTNVLLVYGHETVTELGLDLFGGCYNNRAMRGGTKLSVHAYAAAMDFDPLRNQLRWTSKQAQFAKPVYKPWFDAWQASGARSLGRVHDYDWMHTEFCRG